MSGSPLFGVTITGSGPETALVSLTGELDLATSPLLRRRLDELLDPARMPPLRCLDVDLAPLGFMDAAGLSTLIWAHRTLQARGGRVTLLNSSPMVRRMLALLRLDGVFGVGTD